MKRKHIFKTSKFGYKTNNRYHIKAQIISPDAGVTAVINGSDANCYYRVLHAAEQRASPNLHLK